MKTPFAVLLVRFSDTDETVRAAYLALALQHHPDRNNGEPGPLWYEATEAYKRIQTETLREEWIKVTERRAGLCKSCLGAGVVGTRLAGRKIRLCETCNGAGRTS